MSQIIYRRKHVIIKKCYCKKARKNSKGVYTTCYFTVVNTSKNLHVHVYSDQLRTAQLLANRAAEGKIPENFSEWMKEKIRRII